MFASRNEIIVESQNDPHKLDGQQKLNGDKHVRPNGQQVKKRNMSGTGGPNMPNGGNKRRFQYNQNSTKLAAMLFPSLADSCRNQYRSTYRQNLSPVVEIKVGGDNKKASQHIGCSDVVPPNSPGHQHAGNVGAGVTANPGPEDNHARQKHTGKYHNNYYTGMRRQYHHQQHQQQQPRGHYLYQGDGRNNDRDHKWHCSGWGACTCGYQKQQWNGREYPRTPNSKTGGNFMYSEMPINSRSPTPSLKSESPPAVTPIIHTSPVMVNPAEVNQHMTVSTDPQLSNNRSHHSNDYESDSSHSSQQQLQQQQQQQPYVTSCDYFFDLSSSSYQLAEVMNPQQHQHLQSTSQSSLNSNHTDEPPPMGYSYEVFPYINHRGSYTFLYTEPSPLLNHDVDGYLRKRFVTVASPPDDRRGTQRTSTTTDRRKRYLETPADHFIARAHLVMAKKVPKQLLTGGQWDELSQMVWNRFMLSQQTEETYLKKMNLWKSLFLYIRSSHPRFGLYLVGSTMTGFGADTSDVDMCLVSKFRTDLDPRIEAIVNLTDLQNFLALNKKFEMFHLIEAKVPILRFRDADNHIEVDLNYNNCVGIRNTHLLYWYSNMDWRVRPLVLVVKMWAQYHCINNAKNSTISSYSLVLMVIHFLQVGVSPEILPCLHKLYPEKFDIDNDIRTIHIHENMKAFHSQNHQTLGELFLQFLEYFSNFDYSQYAISVRTASCLSIDFCRMQRSPKNDCHQWKHLCIEEPFDLTNTARSVYDSDVFEKIKFIFLWSWKTLEATMDLNAIFKPIYGYAFHPAPSR